MDIYCTNCAEPWDAADERNIVLAAKRGRCYACEGDPAKASTSFRAEASAMLYDLLGDDTDGAAAMLEDAELLGWLD